MIRAIEHKVSNSAKAASFESLELAQFIFSGRRKGAENLMAVFVDRSLEQLDVNEQPSDQQIVLTLPPGPAPVLVDTSEIEHELQWAIEAREANEAAFIDFASSSMRNPPSMIGD